MTTWLFYALLGIGTGAMYASFSLSLILTYRGSGVVNFAIGAMAMFPAMVFVELRATGDLVTPVVVAPHRFALGEPIAVVPAAGAAMAVGLVVAAVIYALVIRPLRTAPPVTMLVATVGLTLVLQAIAVKNFGNTTLRVAGVLPDGVIQLLGRAYPVDRVWMLVTVCVLAFAVQVTYRRTRFGLATRGAFLNEKGAILLGLEPARIGLYNWMLASALASIVGIVGSSLGGVNPFSFSLFVIPALGAALAARLRSVPVAVVTAVGIGCFESLAVHIVAQRQVPQFFLGGISSLVPFVAIVVALFVVGTLLPTRSTLAERAQVTVEVGRPRVIIWLVTIGAAAMALSSSDATVRFAMLQTIFVATLLLSVVVLTGFVGQVSLAQLSFAGFSAFMLSRFDDAFPFPLGPLTAVVVTTAVGTIVSIPALRVRGVQFAIVTFSVAVVFDDVLFRSPTFVGRGGMAEIRPPLLFGIDLGIAGSGEFPQQRFGYVLLALAMACAGIVVGLRRGPVGRRFLAVRANERSAAASGINVPRTKVLGAAIASFIAGVAGVMFAYKATTFNGGGLEAQDGLELVALGYLGGIGSITGAVIGGVLAPSGIFVVAILGGGSSINQYLLTGLGLVLVAVRFPAGIAGLTGAWRTSRRATMLDDNAASIDQTDGDPDGDVRATFEIEIDDHPWRRL